MDQATKTNNQQSISTNERSIPPISDALGETLYALRLNGLMYANSDLSGEWGIDMPPMPGKMQFHIVTQGACWLCFPDHEPVLLKPGELALMPRGEGHQIASDPQQTCVPFFDIPITQLSERFEYMRYCGSQPQTDKQQQGLELIDMEQTETRITCGVLSFEHVAGQKLISQLPAVIHVQDDGGMLPEQIQMLVKMMATEATSMAAGGETVIAHLADIIVIQALRYWLEQAPEASKGWLGALKDPKIGKALAAIHAHPESPWTVDQLAQQAGMSRSGFSARFSEVIGTSVKQYLTEWRMNLARNKIAQGSVTLADLAEELGYQSEAAFSRAYKRLFGVSPMRG
ncbi:MAG: AraC family transcriptional regulator [Oceanobacter sp.]